MRERIDHYVEILKGIVFMYEQEHGKLRPMASQISKQLKKDILEDKPEKIIQSQINYLHKVNRVGELKIVMMELSHVFD